MSVLTAGAPPRTTLRYQLDTSLARVTPAERAERGKAARARRRLGRIAAEPDL
jgi:hypothetical protein